MLSTSAIIQSTLTLDGAPSTILKGMSYVLLTSITQSTGTLNGTLPNNLKERVVSQTMNSWIALVHVYSALFLWFGIGNDTSCISFNL